MQDTSNCVEYHEGRQYPWCGFHNGSFQYFRHRLEAEYFASTGIAISIQG